MSGNAPVLHSYSMVTLTSWPLRWHTVKDSDVGKQYVIFSNTDLRNSHRWGSGRSGEYTLVWSPTGGDRGGRVRVHLGLESHRWGSGRSGESTPWFGVPPVGIGAVG
ncbi:hypothetical protein FKM82_021987 [Ascaphus truei]